MMFPFVVLMSCHA